MDEALDDCLVGARGRQGVHGGEIWSHQCGPETDGQVLTSHQVQLVVLAHPEKQEKKSTKCATDKPKGTYENQKDI